MEELFIEESEFTPKIWFRPVEKLFQISGYSRPEDVSSFFHPIIDYLEDYGNNYIPSPAFTTGSEVKVEFRLKYFNSSSSKFLLDVICAIIEFKDKGAEVVIEWYYDEGDETIFEAGEDLEDISEIKFNYIEEKI